MSYLGRLQSIRKFLSVGAFALAGVAGGASPAYAETFVNWSKGYALVYTDAWRQVDRQEANQFLMRFKGGDPGIFGYDVILAPDSSYPFYSECYLVVTSEVTDRTGAADIDSTLAALKQSFAIGLRRQSGEKGPLQAIQAQAPQYDSASRTIAQITRLDVEGAPMIATMVMKYFTEGVATLYFYTRAGAYEKHKRTIATVAAGFRDDGLDTLAPPESVTVSERTPQLEAEESSDGGVAGWMYLVIALVVIGSALAWTRIRRGA